MASDDDLYRGLGRVEGQLSLLTASINAHAVALKERSSIVDDRHEKLEKRIRRVENRQHYWAGGAAVLALAADKLIVRWFFS